MLPSENRADGGIFVGCYANIGLKHALMPSYLCILPEKTIFFRFLTQSVCVDPPLSQLNMCYVFNCAHFTLHITITLLIRCTCSKLSAEEIV